MILSNKKGFSLLEIMCVLVIMGIAFAFALPKFTKINEVADQKVLAHTISNLNANEKLSWSNLRLGDLYIDDVDLFAKMSYVVEDCIWTSGPTFSGGGLKCGSAESNLLRSISTDLVPGIWR